MGKLTKITGAELAKLMPGKTLTLPDMHAMLREAHPGHDPESLWVALKTLKGSPNCRMETSLSGRHRTCHLLSASERFFERSVAANRRTVAGKSRLPLSFSEAGLAYITRFNEFDRLLRAVRAH